MTRNFQLMKIVKHYNWKDYVKQNVGRFKTIYNHFHNILRLLETKFFFHHKWNDAWLLVINMVYKMVFRILSDIYDAGFFCEIWTNLSKLISKFPQRLLRLSWEFAQVITLKLLNTNLELLSEGPHDRAALHNTNSWFATNWLELPKSFFLALYDNLVNLTRI